MKNEIKGLILEILENDCGFDIYVAMKNEELIKRLVLGESKPQESGGFKNKIRRSIVDTVKSTFLSDESVYFEGENLADEKNGFYVIQQDDNYNPFEFLTIPDDQITAFRLDDKDQADAILFKFMIQRKGEAKILWAYQKIQPVSIPNKKEKHFQIIANKDRPDVFEEDTSQMFMITKSVDLLVIGSRIITDKISFMERHFALEVFVRASARKAVDAIADVGLISNNDELSNYVDNPNKKYAKKMMQIQKYPVAHMKKDELLKKIYTVERWKDVFEIINGQIHIRNSDDVEQIIDLFTERFTRSDVTDQEYDTSVKDKAKPRVINSV